MIISSFSSCPLSSSNFPSFLVCMFFIPSYFLFSSILVWPALLDEVTFHVNMLQVKQSCLLSIITFAACIVAGACH